MGKVKELFLGTDGLPRSPSGSNRHKRLKHYLGVDPGKDGGLCILRSDGVPLKWCRMPDGKVRIADWITQARDRYANLVLITELAQAMPKQGVTSCFRYGQHFASFEDAALHLRIPYVEVRPHLWKQAMGLSKSKSDSVSACRRLFPTVDLVPPGCRKEHDGIAESLLIAEYGRRKGL